MILWNWSIRQLSSSSPSGPLPPTETWYPREWWRLSHDHRKSASAREHAAEATRVGRTLRSNTAPPGDQRTCPRAHFALAQETIQSIQGRDYSLRDARRFGGSTRTRAAAQNREQAGFTRAAGPAAGSARGFATRGPFFGWFTGWRRWVAAGLLGLAGLLGVILTITTDHGTVKIAGGIAIAWGVSPMSG